MHLAKLMHTHLTSDTNIFCCLLNGEINLNIAFPASAQLGRVHFAEKQTRQRFAPLKSVASWPPFLANTLPWFDAETSNRCVTQALHLLYSVSCSRSYYRWLCTSCDALYVLLVNSSGCRASCCRSCISSRQIHNWIGQTISFVIDTAIQCYAMQLNWLKLVGPES